MERERRRCKGSLSLPLSTSLADGREAGLSHTLTPPLACSREEKVRRLADVGRNTCTHADRRSKGLERDKRRSGDRVVWCVFAAAASSRMPVSCSLSLSLSLSALKLPPFIYELCFLSLPFLLFLSVSLSCFRCFLFRLPHQREVDMK